MGAKEDIVEVVKVNSRMMALAVWSRGSVVTFAFMTLGLCAMVKGAGGVDHFGYGKLMLGLGFEIVIGTWALASGVRMVLRASVQLRVTLRGDRIVLTSLDTQLTRFTVFKARATDCQWSFDRATAEPWAPIEFRLPVRCLGVNFTHVNLNCGWEAETKEAWLKALDRLGICAYARSQAPMRVS